VSAGAAAHPRAILRTAPADTLEGQQSRDMSREERPMSVKGTGVETKQLKVPGTERKDIVPAIEKAAARYVEIRDERMDLTKKEIEAQATLLKAMRDAKKRQYRCDTIEAEVEVVIESEKAKVRRVEISEQNEE
jgi:hypothetical protein